MTAEENLRLASNTIARKIVVMTILFSSCVTFFLSGIQIYNEYRFETRQIGNEIESILAPSFVESISRALWNYDETQLYTLLKSIADRPNILQVKVLGVDGYSLVFGQESRGRHEDKVVPLVFTSKDLSRRIGDLTVIASTQNAFDNIFRRVGIIILANAIKTFLVATFILLLLQRYVTRPMNLIADFARRVRLKAGRGTLEAPPSSPQIQYELKVLNDAIEDLQRNVSRSFEKMNTTHQSLSEVQRLSAMGMLATSVSHDFKNLLAIVTNQLELLKINTQSVKPIDKQILQITSAVERGDAMVKKIMAFAKREKSHLQIVSIKSLLTESADLFQITVTPKVHLKMIIETDGYIEVEANDFITTCINLLINARDALPGGKGEVFMKIQKRTIVNSSEDLPAGAYLTMLIQDNGVGIPKENLRLIFQPFFTTKSEGNGAGLGLAQVKEFMERIRGFVTVESELSKGSTFTLWFPDLG